MTSKLRNLFIYRSTDLGSDVTNVFKTPGKMRGKTPRTGRKRNAQDARIVSSFSNLCKAMLILYFTAAE
jgi:hypothetical protein